MKHLFIIFFCACTALVHAKFLDQTHVSKSYVENGVITYYAHATGDLSFENFVWPKFGLFAQNI